MRGLELQRTKSKAYVDDEHHTAEWDALCGDVPRGSIEDDDGIVIMGLMYATSPSGLRDSSRPPCVATATSIELCIRLTSVGIIGEQMVKDHRPGMHDTLLMAMERISSSKILMDLECIKCMYIVYTMYIV